MKEDKYKYIHYVSYMHSNGTGVHQIYSNWSKIDTETKIKDCEQIIKKGKDFTLTISNILTVKNK